MRTILKRFTSLFLALVMIFTLAPTAALAAGVNESLVSSLAAIYDGDEERARAELDALYEAGLMNADGSLVDLDIREDGESVALPDIARRIADGEEVGNLTVNGNAVTRKKIMQLQQVNSMLEVIRLIDQDVEITDEHVANLQSLIEGIADGSIDLSEVISRGEAQMNENRGARLLGAGDSAAPPTPNNGTGDVEAADGAYTAPYISGVDYNPAHSFALPDPSKTKWYTTSTPSDAGSSTIGSGDTHYTIEPAMGPIYSYQGQEYPTWKYTSSKVNPWQEFVNECTLVATLNETPTVPVSVKWELLPGTYDEIPNSPTKSGTITWSAGDTQLRKEVKLDFLTENFLTENSEEKELYADGSPIALDEDWRSKNEYGNTLYAEGSSSFLVRLYDIQNATFSNKWGKWRCDNNLGVSEFAYRWEHGLGDYSSPFQRISDNEGHVATYNFGDMLDCINQPRVDSMVKVIKVEATPGTYRSGQGIPIKVTLDYHARVDDSIDADQLHNSTTYLTVNGEQIPTVEREGTLTRSIMFVYPVKETDTDTIKITNIEGLFHYDRTNYYAVAVQDFPETTIGEKQGVIIKTDPKGASLDWGNMKYGIDEAQIVTAVIPFKDVADKNWLTSEAVKIASPISMPVPGYPNGAAEAYLRSAYFSTDAGKTRYPVYVLGDNADALVVRFAAPENTSLFLRKDTLSFYYDTEVGTTADYLGAWENKMEDAKGFAYFSATGGDAPEAEGRRFSYYVGGNIEFDDEETVDRPGYDQANVRTIDGDPSLVFYQDGANYVAVQGKDASKQHDVELYANEALFNAVSKGARVDAKNTLRLGYQTSSRRYFSFTDPQYFTWSTDNEAIAKVVKDPKTGAGQISLTGGGGKVTVTLTVGNGSDDKKYDLTFSFIVMEGKDPFLNIPDFSKERVTLTNTNTDVLFASNVTARNAAVGTDTTTFTAKLYEVNAGPSGEPIWTGDFSSTLEQTLTHIDIPGDQLKDRGVYAVVISTTYAGGEVNGVPTAGANFSAEAYLNVRQAPVKITLNQLSSYSVASDETLDIGYELTSGTENTQVQYTIQKPDGTLSEPVEATGGKIQFKADTKPEGLKDAYTITVYARNESDEPWSVDSILLRVYNMDVLDLIVKDVVSGEIGGTTGGTTGGDTDEKTKTVVMDNHGKLSGYLDGDDYKLTVSDLNALRTDMSLQKIISVNYGEGAWGLLSDKMQWSSSDSDLVSIDYKQGGMYYDINELSYVSYGPATDFLLVGKDKTDGVTITAKHVGTGKEASVTVQTETLKDQLYVFQFRPKTETIVTYTNGAGVKREATSDGNGVLAVYEPTGIKSSVMAMSKVGEKTYVGTVFQSALQSGERDIAALRLYPCNNLRLASISDVTLSFRKPDGSAYTGPVTLRAGVYKNGEYCPEAKAKFNGKKYGPQEDITATELTDGKITLNYDPTEFKINPGDSVETGAYQGDRITYVYEYHVPGYQTYYVQINASTDLEGSHKPTDSVIGLIKQSVGDNIPQIIGQTVQQYSGGEPVPYTRDVVAYSDNIGISRKFEKTVLTTDFVLHNSVSADGAGHSVVSGEFALYTENGDKLVGQTKNSGETAVTVTELASLEDAKLYAFPFSKVSYGRNIYTITDANLKANGITDEGENSVNSTRVKAMYKRDGMTVASITFPFAIINLSHQDPVETTKNSSGEIQAKLQSKISIGQVFESIDVNEMLKKGFTFLSTLSNAGGDMPMNIIILPTEDPGVFRLIAMVGKNQVKNKYLPGGLAIDYDTTKMYDEINELVEELEEDDGDGDGNGEVNASFSGTLVIEAGYDFSKKQWELDFRGGSLGLRLKAKYEWPLNFMCGPVPATISFEVGANAAFKVSFASKSSVKLMLVDTTIGVYIEAFAGIGFDASVAKLKLGIYGRIGADVNFLLLTNFAKSSNGTELSINGEIGIRLEVKVLFVNYKKTFASTGFNWTKDWNKYKEIKEAWEKNGFAEIFGVTTSGRAYSMQLYASGVALVTVDGGGEIENRDYLELANRAWKGGASSGARLMTADGDMINALNDVQTNAYPYANPVFTDDGSMFLYISDNENAEEPKSVVSYAVKSGIGYGDMGPVVTEKNNILADSDVVASGTGNSIFAAWVKQHESPEKEMKAKTTIDDLGMMMNATEIYAGVYNGTDWTTERLTTNSVADMSPTVASSDNKAIVAWRSMAATELPKDDAAQAITDEINPKQDITASFNAENNVNYRVYNGTKWTEAQIAYNGATGTVNAIDSAMLSDGTSILVYTVRTGKDVTSTETFYTLVGADGKVLTTGRLTNDDFTDTNAQVTAVGNQFVLGWYSEYDTGEKAVNSEEAVVAHDVRLARINWDGSVDAAFPESIGGDADSSITSDFRFSAPAGCNDLNTLSVVWSQKKDSEDENDAGKYELNAVRFYQEDDAIGFTAPTNIAETAKNNTVDHFDTYTDKDGRIYALIMNSDYSNIAGLSVYDSINLSNLPLVTTNSAGENKDHLRILEAEPEASIKLGSGTFPVTAVKVTADTNIRELVPGLNLPVQFKLKNIGTSTVEEVAVKLGEKSQTVSDLSLLPNQSAIITVSYPVPEDKVEDVSYTVSADGEDMANGELILNRPDVGVTGMKLLSEENGERIVQVRLNNASGIPLAGSGKTVKLGLYKTADHEEDDLVGEIITISGDKDLADIDEGIYGAVQTLEVKDLIEQNAKEIPDSGIQLYAHAWVDGVKEPYTTNNDSFMSFKGLLTKYESVMTMDTFVEENNGQYTVKAFIRNNSLQNTDLGSITADILDDKNNVLESVELTNSLMLTGEHEETLTSEPLTIDDGTPSSVALRSSTTSVLLDAVTNGGVADTTAVVLTKDGTLPALMPSATKAGYRFNGWFTEPSGGEKVTAETVFGINEEPAEGEEAENTIKKVEPNEDGVYVIYAQFTRNPSGGSSSNSTITVPVSGESASVSVSANVSGTTATVEAPTAAQLEQVIGESVHTGDVTIDVSGLNKDITTVSIPTETVKDIEKAINDPDNDTIALTIKLPDGSVTFDAKALAAIVEQSKGSTIQLNLDNIGESKLKSAQKTAIKDMDVQAVYDAYLTSNGQRISDFKGGKATVTISYTLKDGQTGRGVVVWYVAEDGKTTEVPSVYSDKTVSFTVEHFSNYVIAYDEERAAVCPQDATCPISDFTDASATAWYHDGVHFALENNIMSGYGNGKFGPGNATSRAMIAQILWNMEGKPIVNYAISYTDVDADAWYAEAVRWATAQGIMNGYGGADGGKFGPNDDMTREQLVTIMYRYAQMKKVDVSIGEDTNILSYDDAFDVSEWAIPAMQWAVGAGIVNGTSASTLSPKNNASRAEIATIVTRYCTEIAK